jgi:hypothetical protein
MDYEIHSRKEISDAIQALADEFNAIIESLDTDAFKENIPGKWSIAENIEHLINTNTVTALGLASPKSILALGFGKRQEASRGLKELVRNYQLAINSGAGSPILYLPKVPLVHKEWLKKGFNLSIEGLLKASSQWTEADLDTYQLPHPILGKLSARELLGFSVYHLYHHLNTVKALALYAAV